jgi:hypothetical protein
MVWAEIAQVRLQGQLDLLAALLVLAQIAEDVRGRMATVGWSGPRLRRADSRANSICSRAC